MRILAQSRDYVVVHKPSGLVTYADSREQEKISAKAQLEKQLKRPLFPVHRIDKDTCGVLAFAFHPNMAKELTALFRSRTVKKQYLAIVHGEIPGRGTIDEPLERNKEKTKEAALTEYTRLEETRVTWEGEERIYSLVKLDPKTGRYHQLRRHLRFIGHPIIGDPQYGNAWDNRVFEEKFGVKRTLLSATSLNFPDRAQQRMVRVKTRPDGDFEKVMKAFGWKF